MNAKAQQLSDMGVEKLEVIQQCLNLAPSGLYAEVGVCRGGTSLMALNEHKCDFLVCIDPYLAFNDMMGNPIRMTDEYYYEAIESLIAVKKPFVMYKMTSKEFIDSKFNFYVNGSKLERGDIKFSYVLLDGEHTDNAVGMELEYFSKRMVPGGILVIDNIDWIHLDFDSTWVAPRFDMKYKIF